MKRCFLLALLVFTGPLLVAASALAQEVDPIDELVSRTIDACVGPRLLADVGLEETLEVLAAAPGDDCRKACKISGKTCLQLVKSEDKCGKVFLKGSGRAASALCQDSLCKRGIKELLKAALSTYIGQGDAVRSQCAQGVTACEEVCQP
jgi:hypothetical protein